MKKKDLYRIIIIASLIGIAISSYLISVSYSDQSVVCIAGGNSASCNNVSSGPYSRIMFNIPNSVIGLAGFVIFLILGYLGTKNKKVEKIFVILSSVSLVFVLYLAYLVFIVIQSFCIWCFTSWVMVMIILMCSILLKRK